MSQDPKRLVDDAGDLGNAIAALQKQAPSELRLDAMARRLAEAGAPMGPLEPLVEPAGGEVSRLVAQPKLRVLSAKRFVDSGLLLVVLALGVGAGLIATAIAVVTPDTPITPPPLPVPATTTTAAMPPSHVEHDVTEAPALSSSQSAPGAQPTRDERPTASHAPDAAPPLVPSATSATGSPPAPLGVTSAAPPPTAAHEATVAAATPRATSSVRAPLRASPESTGAPLAENTVVETEVELLKHAKSALGADPLQAFALTERCRAQYPNGSFSQEREYIAISALARLGRGDEARSRAALFRMHYPNSAYLTRLASLLGEP